MPAIQVAVPDGDLPREPEGRRAAARGLQARRELPGLHAAGLHA